MTTKWGFLLCGLLVGCGSETSNGANDASDGGTDAAATDASSDSALEELDGAPCPDSLAPFKTCTDANQCAIEATGNCCGDGLYVGVAGLSVSNYQRCFPPPSCAGLGCASSSRCKAEDGNVASCAFDTKALAVACDAGSCETYILATDGGDGG